MTTTVAFFGGSFNPPHIGHQMAVLYVLETQAVDRVLVVPCFRHPFEKELAPFGERLEMSRMAMAPLGERIEVSDIEERLGGASSRTYDTISALRREMPLVSWRTIVGADILAERAKWWRWEELTRIAPLLVLGRQGYGGGAIELPRVSSSEVRERLRQGMSVSELVPKSVALHIRARGLYGVTQDMP